MEFLYPLPDQGKIKANVGWVAGAKFVQIVQSVRRSGRCGDFAHEGISPLW